MNASAVNLAVCPANLAAIIGAGRDRDRRRAARPASIGKPPRQVNCGWVGIAGRAAPGNQLTALGLYA